jgi:hypothetical protein
MVGIRISTSATTPVMLNTMRGGFAMPSPAAPLPRSVSPDRPSAVGAHHGRDQQRRDARTAAGCANAKRRDG